MLKGPHPSTAPQFSLKVTIIGAQKCSIRQYEELLHKGKQGPQRPAQKVLRCKSTPPAATWGRQSRMKSARQRQSWQCSHISPPPVSPAQLSWSPWRCCLEVTDLSVKHRRAEGNALKQRCSQHSEKRQHPLWHSLYYSNEMAEEESHGREGASTFSVSAVW